MICTKNQHVVQIFFSSPYAGRRGVSVKPKNHLLCQGSLELYLSIQSHQFQKITINLIILPRRYETPSSASPNLSDQKPFNGGSAAGPPLPPPPSVAPPTPPSNWADADGLRNRRRQDRVRWEWGRDRGGMIPRNQEW